MSYTFSRRDFLKYSALTVVAVAGAGMLSGCEIQDPNNPIVYLGKSNSIGTTAAILEPANEKKMDGTFNLSIRNTSDSPLLVDNRNALYSLKVTTTDEEGKDVEIYNSGVSGIVVNSENLTSDKYPQLASKNEVTLPITAQSFPDLYDGRTYTVVFQYVPRASQSEYSMRWKWIGPDTTDGE